MFTAKLSLVACLAGLSLAACAASTDPSSDPQPTGDTAEEITVAKCKGVLPHICEVCADGKSECAHWTVKNKKCAVAICSAPSSCVQNLICATNSHFDHSVCKCVPN
jgi:hypothetical protein